MTMEARTTTVPVADVIPRLDRLAADISAIREDLRHLGAIQLVSPQVTRWVRKVNAVLGNSVSSQAERAQVVAGVPDPLRHAVAAECYRTNGNITFGWVAAIAGILTFEVPDLLRAYGVEPDESPLSPEEMSEQVALIKEHRYGATRQ